MSIESVVLGNRDLFTLTDDAVAAEQLQAQREALAEEIGEPPMPMTDAELGAQAFGRGTPTPSLAELRSRIAQRRDDEDARSLFNMVAISVGQARGLRDSKVRAPGSAYYIEQLRAGAWTTLLAEVKELGDVSMTKEQAWDRDDRKGYEALQSLVERADRIRRLHRELLGEIRIECRRGAFLDSRQPPEVQQVGQPLKPAGPDDPGERLKWLAAQGEVYLAPTAAAASSAFVAWYGPAISRPMDVGPLPTAVRSTIRREGGR